MSVFVVLVRGLKVGATCISGGLIRRKNVVVVLRSKLHHVTKNRRVIKIHFARKLTHFTVQLKGNILELCVRFETKIIVDEHGVQKQFIVEQVVPTHSGGGVSPREI